MKKEQNILSYVFLFLCVCVFFSLIPNRSVFSNT